MTQITVVKSGFNEAEIEVTAESKRARVDGESFIVDWGDITYGEPQSAFKRITESIRGLLEPSFVPQCNHHSTIVSKRLAPIDRPEDFIPPVWTDPEFSSCRRVFREHLHDFVLELQLCVCASGGTIHLVYRNEGRMPRIRQELIALGAEVKAGTLTGDRLNTCTVVLGYLSQVPERDIGEHEIGAAIAIAPRSVSVTCASLVQYRDTSLNEYETLERFEGA